MVLQLTVADVMTQPVLTVTPDTPLQQAVQMISDHHVSGLPVVIWRGTSDRRADGAGSDGAGERC